MNLKNLTILATTVSLFAACHKKPDQSSVTGWNYNDSKMGGFQVSKEKEQHTGPGLVFVQGGTFTMGATQE
ncbi:MAG TPA: gliding motility lipoprotein GldJ, partial [Puia sp.]|nr:gliding motility lipoprotein GldJ [Puia sp.]